MIEGDMLDTVTIPKAEYARLIEAAELLDDLKALEEFKARMQRGEEEIVPDEFVQRMLDGESLTRLWREHRSMTQVALSKASGVNRVQIAEIESGKKTGSVGTLKKLADGLGVTVDDLI